MRTLEVTFTPAEFAGFAGRDLRTTTCVVFDVLRATTSMLAALQAGAEAVLPVGTIAEALALKECDPAVVLAGERGGYRISAEQTGGVAFDLGNSPREMTPSRVAGRRLVMTTTNGTRALQACRGAGRVLLGSFGNLSRLTAELSGVEELLLVCSGTHEEAAWEDTLGAGALCDAVWEEFPAEGRSDSAQMARALYLECRGDLAGSMGRARNARRLMSIPELREDVAFCLDRDRIPVIGEMDARGEIRVRGVGGL